MKGKVIVVAAAGAACGDGGGGGGGGATVVVSNRLKFNKSDDWLRMMHCKHWNHLLHPLGSKNLSETVCQT